MVFKGTASLLIRLSRALITRPFKPVFTNRIYERPPVSHYPTTYLFPSIYRSVFAPSNGKNFSNLKPFRMALNEIKRRLFYAVPSSSHLMLGLLGYTIVQQSSNDYFRLDDTFHKIGRLLSKTSSVDQIHEENENYSRESLDDYELGRLIGHGCNAAVYEARLRSSPEKGDSDIEILSRESSFEICDVDNDKQNQADELLKLDTGANGNLQQSDVVSVQTISSNDSFDILPAGQFNLAIKMLFNYDIPSNSEAIKKAMNKELIPLLKSLYHPNLVRMYSSFVDSFPLLQEAYELYPMALPTRLSSASLGRNKTLFIVMRRYDLTLSQYIQSNQPNNRERLLLFAQLLEALLYLNNHSIAHRDLKSDNILICNETGELVLVDFGCALHHSSNLKISYQTDEVCKGGNIALMAPEIVNCQPGQNVYLDYNKADLWASGSLFYEFFSQPNPFVHGTLQQDTYDDKKLPSLSPNVSPIIERLVHSILRKDPEQRPTVTLASNCMHLCLWFQSVKSKNELYQAYMWTALETLFKKHKLTRVELTLKKLFFERQTCQSLYHAQTFLNQL